MRPDRVGSHRTQFDKNRKRLLKTQRFCGICGKEIPNDPPFKFPHPLSPSVDHIVPVSKGGSPSSIDNLTLTHWCCNRQKGDKLYINNVKKEKDKEVVSNRVLPHSIDWTLYKAK